MVYYLCTFQLDVFVDIPIRYSQYLEPSVKWFCRWQVKYSCYNRLNSWNSPTLRFSNIIRIFNILLESTSTLVLFPTVIFDSWQSPFFSNVRPIDHCNLWVAVERPQREGGWNTPATYPATLGLVLQRLDGVSKGLQVRHQGLVLLQQGLGGVFVLSIVLWEWKKIQLVLNFSEQQRKHPTNLL